MFGIDFFGKLVFMIVLSKGIGFGVVRVLVKVGVDVVFLFRSEENLKRVKEKIRVVSDVEVSYIVVDFIRREDFERMVKEFKDIGEFDIFFFFIGGFKFGYFMEMDMEDWEGVVKFFFYFVVYFMRVFVLVMEWKGFGRIVYFISVVIKELIFNIVLSNVVRILMVGFVRMFVKEFGLKGIIVNGIMFGIIKIDRMIWLVKDRV